MIDHNKTSRGIGFLRSKKRLFILALIAVASFIIGYSLSDFGGDNKVSAIGDVLSSSQPTDTTATIWTCAMHPQIRLPKPGKCPICFMDLIPVKTDAMSSANMNQLKMSKEAIKLADIQTTPVISGKASAETRLFGKVAYDETRLATIAARAPGRITKLYVDYTGTAVKAGQQMAEMYSPELFSAQQELIDALELSRNVKGGTLEQTAATTVEAARRKLRLLGLTDQQIDGIEKTAKASEYVTFYAPSSGVVVEKAIQAGDYVDTGSRLYAIADLSTVWVMLEAYESDLPWLKTGEPLSFTSPSFPGDRFTGRIVFIDPIVDDASRTVRVRAEVNNREMKFKPDMFVTGTVQSSLSDGPNSDRTALLIPASAPLITGKRAVVYVRNDANGEPTFEGREVTLGVRTGDYYVVKAGLAEGERVVTNGAFKIDSELQIQAKSSMMNPSGGGGAPGHQHLVSEVQAATLEQSPRPAQDGALSTVSKEARSALTPLYAAYFDVQNSLAADDYESSLKAYGRVKSVVNSIPMNLFEGPHHEQWMELSSAITRFSENGEKAEDIKAARDMFYDLSQNMIKLHTAFGHADSVSYYLAYCPMARNNSGAYWMQTQKIINNSYWGAAMLRCGEIKTELAGSDLHEE